MHTCLKCGKEFDGKFCPECGTMFVDENACPKCGAIHAPGAKYCSECGARLDGKKVCPKCGAEATGAFCTECGTKIGADKKPQRAARTGGGEKVKSILYLSGVICLLVAALAGLAFTFACGVTLQGETNTLYYYFGEAFKDIKDIQKEIETDFEWKYMGSTREFGLYFPAAIGTAASAVGILGVVALCGLTGYRAFQRFYKKKDVNVALPAVGAYLTFATLATILLSLNSASAAGIQTKFSAPTLAGLIVGGVFCGAGITLIAASGYEVFKGFDGTVGAISAVAVGALATVIIALMALPSGGVVISYADTVLGAILKKPVHTNVGLFGGMNSMILVTRSDEAISEIIAYASVGGVAGIALAVISAVVIFRKSHALCGGGKNGCLILNSVNVALAVLYLTFTILFINKMVEITALEDNDMVSKDFAVPIVVLVMAALALAAELAGRFVRRRKNGGLPETAEAAE